MHTVYHIVNIMLSNIGAYNAFLKFIDLLICCDSAVSHIWFLNDIRYEAFVSRKGKRHNPAYEKNTFKGM